jgi:hypothetical protein
VKPGDHADKATPQGLLNATAIMALSRGESCSCSFAQRDLAPAGSVPVIKGFDQPIEESRRQETVIVAVAVRPLSQIVTRPDKFIAFADDDPRRIVVEPDDVKCSMCLQYYVMTTL